MFTGQRFSEGPATVLLDQEKIIGVETRHLELDESWQVVEYRNATVLPGLIDTHVHLVADSQLGALDRVPGLGDEELNAVITEGLRHQLAAGVTTVRDLGDRRFAVVARRDEQRGGRTEEPTIVADVVKVMASGGFTTIYKRCVSSASTGCNDYMRGAYGSSPESTPDSVRGSLTGIFTLVCRSSTMRASRLQRFLPQRRPRRPESVSSGTEKGCSGEGYDADLVVVEGDLRDDIAALQQVGSVVLAGKQVG
jgi:imidazolonepropionase-like amidohydrolase